MAYRKNFDRKGLVSWRLILLQLSFFFLPNLFQQKLTKYELEARFKLFQVFISVSIEKKIM